MYVTIVSEKRERGIKVKEGKEPMSFSCYKLTCELLVVEGTSEAIFLLFWITLQWNLMSRSEVTEGVCFLQIRYENETLKVYFLRMKNDQIGLNKDEAHHIYSNPLIPAVSPLRHSSHTFFDFQRSWWIMRGLRQVRIIRAGLIVCCMSVL